MIKATQLGSLCNCGKDKAYKDGLCIGCYSIATIEALKDKQIVPYDGRRNPRKRRCIICRAKGTHAKNRCKMCYEYRRRRGIDRPPYLIDADQKGCVNCGRRTKLKGHARCKRCYEYFWRFGRERPPSRFDWASKVGQPCENCGKKPSISSGRCKACYYYKYRHGTERPERLFNRV